MLSLGGSRYMKHGDERTDVAAHVRTTLGPMLEFYLDPPTGKSRTDDGAHAYK